MNEQQKLAEALQKAIDKTDKMLQNGTHSYEYIVGYLQGTIEETIKTLNK